MVVVNSLALHVLAMQRSGHHAIIQWIFANADAPKCFLNHCSYNRAPFASCKLSESMSVGVDLAAEAAGTRQPKHLVICNYEDADPRSVFVRGRSECMDGWIGCSRASTNVLVIRDPFNTIASKFRWFMSGRAWPPTWTEMRMLSTIWKSHAYEATGRTSFIPEPKVVVSYNRWCLDEKYRSDLASRFGIGSGDLSRNEVAPWGPNTWGDSVDGMSFEGRASEMDVFRRWQLYKNDEAYRSLFRDNELFELSREIFGAMDGVADLRGEL